MPMNVYLKQTPQISWERGKVPSAIKLDTDVRFSARTMREYSTVRPIYATLFRILPCEVDSFGSDDNVIICYLSSSNRGRIE